MLRKNFQLNIFQISIFVVLLQLLLRWFAAASSFFMWVALPETMAQTAF